MSDIELEDFATKYRPTNLKTFAAPQHLKNLLNSLFEKRKFPKTILITGRTSAGKTTLARILANEIMGVENCLDCNDYSEINVGDERGIDSIRNIVASLKFKPTEAQKRVVLLDEVHTITNQAASSLLKPLEELPNHVVVILCTDNPQKLLQTIQNRCFKIALETPTPEELMPIIKRAAKKEGLPIKEDYIRMIAESADGQPRTALKMLQAICNMVTEDSGDIKKAIKSAVQDVLKVDEDTNVIKYLLSLYSGNAKVAMTCISNTNDFNFLINKALEYHRFMFDQMLHNEGIKCNRYYWSPTRDTLFKQAQKKCKDWAIKAVEIHTLLVDIKREMGTYAVNEYHIFMVRTLSFLNK